MEETGTDKTFSGRNLLARADWNLFLRHWHFPLLPSEAWKLGSCYGSRAPAAEGGRSGAGPSGAAFRAIPFLTCLKETHTTSALGKPGGWPAPTLKLHCLSQIIMKCLAFVTKWNKFRFRNYQNPVWKSISSLKKFSLQSWNYDHILPTCSTCMKMSLLKSWQFWWGCVQHNWTSTSWI